MKVKRLKEILNELDENLEVFIRNSVNPAGNIQELDQIEEYSYAFFSSDVECLILNTDSSKDIEIKNDEIIDLISNK